MVKLLTVWLVVVLLIVDHELAPICCDSQRTMLAACVLGVQVSVAVLVVGDVALHTVTAVPTVPTVVSASTVILLVNESVGDEHEVALLVIPVIVTGNDEVAAVVLVKTVWVLNVNVPDPVPDAPVMDVAEEPFVSTIVPANVHPCVEATLDTVTLQVLALPEHTGPPTLFKVIVGNTFTFTVAVDVKVEFEHPVADIKVESNDTIDTSE